SGLLTTRGDGSSAGPNTSEASSTSFSSGALMDHVPVASPLAAFGPQQFTGRAGYTPLQLQTAYGLSSGASYNDKISFAAIKGHGAGQAIAIYGIGTNPAFVDTDLNGDPAQGTNPAYSTSALAVFYQMFKPPDPPSLTFYDEHGHPITASNPGFGNQGQV